MINRSIKHIFLDFVQPPTYQFIFRETIYKGTIIDYMDDQVTQCPNRNAYRLY